jgi:hypothetical protein
LLSARRKSNSSSPARTAYPKVLSASAKHRADNVKTLLGSESDLLRLTSSPYESLRSLVKTKNRAAEIILSTCDFIFNEGFDVQFASAFCWLRIEGKSCLHSSREWFAFRRATLVKEMRQRKANG